VVTIDAGLAGERAEYGYLNMAGLCGAARGAWAELVGAGVGLFKEAKAKEEGGVEDGPPAGEGSPHEDAVAVALRESPALDDL
jgi:hypothetical protein